MLKEEKYRLNCKDVDSGITVIYDSDVAEKALIVYIHGGGLLFGSRNDLPLKHRRAFTAAGYKLVCIDYHDASRLCSVYSNGCHSIDRVTAKVDLLISMIPIEETERLMKSIYDKIFEQNKNNDWIKETLDAYFESNMNIQKAAESIHIHKIQKALDHRHLLPVTEGHAFSYVFLFYADAAYEA